MEPATNEEPSSNTNLEEEPLKTSENPSASSDNHYHRLANEYMAQAIQNCSEETQKEIAQELEKQVKGGEQC